jgi:deoxyadenosine/deoxycytidine kinase
LRTDPEICMERIRKRGRVEERKLTLKYIKQLHESHEQWLGRNMDSHPDKKWPCPVVTIDGNIKEESYPQLLLRIIKELNKLIEGNTEKESQWNLDEAIHTWESRKERVRDVIG